MASSYTSSVLPSIEKRFGFSSKTMGIILSVNDVGIIVMALITAHFAGHHRPRGLFLGSSLCGFALLLHALPEAVFPVDATSFLGKIIEDESSSQLCEKSNKNSSVAVQNATVCALEEDGNLGALVFSWLIDSPTEIQKFYFDLNQPIIPSTISSTRTENSFILNMNWSSDELGIDWSVFPFEQFV